MAHIHGPAAPGANAPVIFDFAGVPNATSGAIPEQTFAITPAQVADLINGLHYFNIHNASFPSGEIRGQIGGAPPVPTPTPTPPGAPTPPARHTDATPPGATPPPTPPPATPDANAHPPDRAWRTSMASVEPAGRVDGDNRPGATAAVGHLDDQF